jgi:serine/threonine protein kinase
VSEEPNQPDSPPPVSVFTGPVGELIAQRMLAPPPRPGVLAVVDGYEVLRVLGGGGMGIVLLARATQTGREVAVKLVRSDLVNDQNVVHRFLKEAGHLKKLRHTNIVPVEEISDRAEGPYFVMPYFEKGSLANRIKPGVPLNTETILDIAIPVAEGLSFAHRSGIIHRDLKPANILLGANGAACLADFGLARSMFNDTIVDVESRQMEGTAPYVSPGVAAGDAEDTRCDIFSFGALLYEMLTGQPPYKGRGTKEILAQIIAGPPKPITSLNPAADRGLVAIAEKAMARELRNRYADMRDVLTDLQLARQGKRPGADIRGKPFGPSQLAITLGVLLGIAAIGVIGLLSSHVRQPSSSALSNAPATGSAPPKVTNQIHAQTPVSSPDISVLAGSVGVAGSSDGLGSDARFHLPHGIAADRAGNIYVADTGNNTIRKIAPNGIVSTLAGLAGSHGSEDGIGNSARFWAPFGVAVDNSGNVYVSDTLNNTIRKISVSGTVTTLAGKARDPGSDDGIGTVARFRNPWGVAVDGSGNIYVADSSNDQIRKIAPDGRVSTLAGKAGEMGLDNGDGNPARARFNGPFGVAVDTIGRVYVADTGNSVIRQIQVTGVVSSKAPASGPMGIAGADDGFFARFSNPQGIAVGAPPMLLVYVADTGNGRLRRIVLDGEVTTLLDAGGGKVAFGKGSDGSFKFSNPGGVAVDAAGNIYVSDTGANCVRKITGTK